MKIYRRKYPLERGPLETRYLSCAAFRWQFFRGGGALSAPEPRRPHFRQLDPVRR